MFIVKTVTGLNLTPSFFSDQKKEPIIRFGTALARTRTKFLKKHRAKAIKFLRDAKKSRCECDARPRVNRAWIAGADLQPVLDFLSQRWKPQGEA